MSRGELLLSGPEGVEEAAARVSEVVLSGGIVLYPSDTVYGLMCRADDREAVDRLRRLKGCPEKRPFIIVVDGTGMAGRLADCTDPEVAAIMELRWPGRLTLALPALEECPPWVTGEDGTVALRHPADRLSSSVLGRCGIPLVSTSANLAGGGVCLDYRDVPSCIAEEVDLAVNAGKLPESGPSTILRLVRGRKWNSSGQSE